MVKGPPGRIAHQFFFYQLAMAKKPRANRNMMIGPSASLPKLFTASSHPPIRRNISPKEKVRAFIFRSLSL
jgi:hypothetical protein